MRSSFSEWKSYVLILIPAVMVIIRCISACVIMQQRPDEKIPAEEVPIADIGTSYKSSIDITAETINTLNVNEINDVRRLSIIADCIIKSVFIMTVGAVAITVMVTRYRKNTYHPLNSNGGVT